MKLSIGSWAYTIGPYSHRPIEFDTVCSKLAEYGFDGVELGGFTPHPNPDDLPEKSQRQDVVDKVKSYGLEISGLAANLWGENLINATDNCGKYISEFKKNINFCVDLGIKTIRVDTVQPPTIFSEVDYATAKKRVVNTWKTCCDIAADNDLLVTWEAEPGFAFNKYSEIIEILHAVDKDNFGLLYDTCHGQMIGVVGARQNGEKETFGISQVEYLKKVRDFINHVHIIDSDNTCHKDANGNDETSAHPPLGNGILNFDQIIPELNKINLKYGWWTIDLCYWKQAWDATKSCKKYLDKYTNLYASGLSGVL